MLKDRRTGVNLPSRPVAVKLFPIFRLRDTKLRFPGESRDFLDAEPFVLRNKVSTSEHPSQNLGDANIENYNRC